MRPSPEDKSFLHSSFSRRCFILGFKLPCGVVVLCVLFAVRPCYTQHSFVYRGFARWSLSCVESCVELYTHAKYTFNPKNYSCASHNRIAQTLTC